MKGLPKDLESKHYPLFHTLLKSPHFHALTSRVNQYNQFIFVKSERINMTRAWDKEKIAALDGNRTHDLPNTGRALYPLS